jgi:myo-inositol 2-dehydrogenase / D-chiro-inositol 1-dehydrogenase
LDKLNLGIIGLGNQGNLHLQNCLRLKEVSLLGVADTSKHSLQQAVSKGVKKVYSNYEDLLKDDKINAVIVSLPNFLHLECAEKAAEAGKDILMEKPLAGNVDDGERILSSVRKNGVKLMVGYSMRFDPMLRDLRERIVDGVYGDVQVAEATNVSNGPFTPRGDHYGPTPVPDWWFDKNRVGGGALMDLGVHLIDLFAWYFGEVESVSSYLGYKFNMELEDLALCIMRFKQGPIAVVNAGWFSKEGTSSISINGTSDNFTRVISPRTRKSLIWNDLKKRLGVNTRSSSLEELKYFIDTLQKGEKPSPSGEEGLIDLQTISMAYRNSSQIT